jgi:predicted nucleic acid-binding protein
MILLDTNVLIYASNEASEYCNWARNVIAKSVAGDGAAVNAVSLAEICLGEANPQYVADRIRSWGVSILDIPAAAADICAKAYAIYRVRRRKDSGKDAPIMPLPDFFIGAHAQIMGWMLATADVERFRIYFPTVALKSPSKII